MSRDTLLSPLVLALLFLTFPCTAMAQTPKEEAWALENKAADLFEAGKLEQADQVYRQVLAVYRKQPRLDKIGVGRVQFNRARLLLRLGQYDKAERAIHDALVGHENHYGKDHPKMAAVREEAGYLMRAQNSFAAAVDHYQAAFQIREKEFIKHAGMVKGQVEQNLKLFLQQRDLFSEYRLEASIELALRLAGKNPKDQTERLHGIQKKLAGAITKENSNRVFTWGIILQNKHDGEVFREKSRSYANAAYGLGISNVELGKPVTGAKYLQRALVCFEMIDGVDKGFTPKVFQALKKVYRTRGNAMDEAFLEARQKFRDSKDKTVLSAITVDDAEHSLRTMLRVMERGHGPRSKELEESLIYLGIILELQGKFDEAKKVFARLETLEDK